MLLFYIKMEKCRLDKAGRSCYKGTVTGKSDDGILPRTERFREPVDAVGRYRRFCAFSFPSRAPEKLYEQGVTVAPLQAKSLLEL